MLEIGDLLTLANEYERVTGVGDTTLSFRVFGDSKKLTALRGQGDITTTRFRSAMFWFASNWPEAAGWPEGIERPKLAEVSGPAAEPEGAAA